jgi:hypothetical protein
MIVLDSLCMTDETGMKALDSRLVAVHGSFDYGNIHVHPREVLEVVPFPGFSSRMAALHKSSHLSRSGCQKVHHRVGIC